MPDSRSHRSYRVALPLLVLVGLVAAACQSGSESVVTERPASPAPGASAGASATPDALAPNPAVSPILLPATSPLPSPGQSGATSPPGSGGSMTNMPGVTTSVYKPTPTPGDPFPPRPTPSLVIKDGKPVQEWQAPPEALTLTNPVKGTPDAIRIGESLYNQRCVDCHGKRGYGNGIMSRGLRKPPTNLASRMVQANTDGELFWKITNGRSPMPANRVRFEEEQRWYIVTFLRSLK